MFEFITNFGTLIMRSKILKGLLGILLISTPLLAEEYQVGVAMIFRDEAPYLKEWIAYHRLIGVEHFWLFNNLSKDDYKEVLAPYIQEGLVELYDVPIDCHTLNQWNAVQTRSYNRALNYARGRCKWLAVIDADEFILPMEVETIEEALIPYEEYPAVALHWLIFGTSMVEKIAPDRLMIESLTMHGQPDLEENRYVKLIVKPKETIGFNGPHMCSFLNQSAVNTDFVAVRTKMDMHITHTALRVNHYWSRDLDYLEHVKIPRSKISGGSWAAHMERELKTFNLFYDATILRFVPRLRAELGLDLTVP
jgi:glycosyltransferase involved in cell wall biosynthesis